MTSEMGSEDYTKVSYEEIPEEARKLFEEAKRARDQKDLEEFLAHYNKNRQKDVVQATPPAMPVINVKPKVIKQVPHSREDFKNMLDG